MSTGSLKDLVRALSNALSSFAVSHPLPEDVMTVVQSYLDKHTDIDDHDSQRLHDELMNLHTTKVVGHPEKHATFLATLRALRPAVNGVDRLLAWWDILVRPTLDSLGQAKAVVADARAIVLNVLVYDEDEDKEGGKAKAAAVFTEKLFEVFLEKTKLVLTADGGAGFAEEERQRYVVSNVEAVLLAYGKRRPKKFLETIDSYVIQKEYRLQVLGLLCSFVRLQGPHLYLVLQTPLLSHLLQCLQIDTSTTVISLALTILIMFMPHICNSLSKYLPQLFVIYTRVLCWDKYGIVRLEDIKFPIPGGKETHMRADSPDSTKGENTWQKLDSSFETASSAAPDVSDFFTFLYGLYPINFVTFIREPYKFLERAQYMEVEDLDFDEETIRIRTEQYRQRHTLHPNFFTLTAETEITDQARWMKVEPSDVTALCIGLVNSHIQLQSYDPKTVETHQILPDALLPTEDIPIESLLSMEDGRLTPEDSTADPSETGGYSWKESGAPVNQRYADVIASYPRRSPLQLSYANSPSIRARDSRILDSPTLPPQLGRGDEARVQDMLHLQESLRSGITLKTESTTSLPMGNGHGSVTASPRLEAYVHSLNQNTIPRSPAVRPAASDSQASVAYLQREVMLLKNDLNFERYLKQQHLSHIGHLQRKHIKESAAEAETQNLIYTNKALKAKLEDAKKAFVRAKSEALASKNQSKKWEAELNGKIRALRDEQKAWKAEEEAVKRALEAALKDLEHMRRLVAESEAKELLSRQRMKAVEANLAELGQLREMNEQLRKRLQEFDERNDEFEMQKHAEEAAVAQADRIKIRLQAQQHEKVEMKRAYEQKVKELEAKLTAAHSSNSGSPNLSPGMQAMVDSALSQANQRLASLKKAHHNLVTKYTELEIKYIELQAGQEIENLPGNSSNNNNPNQNRDGNPHSHIGNHYNDNSFSPTEEHGYPHRSHQMHSPHHHHTFSEGGPTSPTDQSRNNHHHQNSPYFQPTSNSSHNSQQMMPPNSPGFGSMMSPHTPTYMNFNSIRYGTMSPTPPPTTPIPPTPIEMQHHRDQQQQHRQSYSDLQFNDMYNRAHGPQLKNMPSVPESMSMSMTNDSRSVKTTGSSQDSTAGERRKIEKTKPGTERVRGRGGVQNVKKDKRDKDKSAGTESNTEGENRAEGGKDKKKERKYKFPTGSGLAGIRGFV